MTSTQTVDGRSARAQRTRDSVVGAVLDLVSTGQARPTAREIADAAGISVRSVYVHFDDLEDLFCVADQRIQIHERFGAVRRAAEQWAPQSPALADVLHQGRVVGRQDIERLFGAELAGRVDHDTTLSAIILLLGLTGPVVLMLSFALRFGLGFDASWYLVELAADRVVSVPLVAMVLATGACGA